MREIKFRAWDKTHKKMLDRVLAGPGDPCSIVWQEEDRRWVQFDDFCGTIMQYTGLKDSNDRDIYEGDIVCVEDAENRTVAYGLASFHLVNHITESRILLEDRSTELLEVLGNIYEHPELLEVKEKGHD